MARYVDEGVDALSSRAPEASAGTSSTRRCRTSRDQRRTSPRSAARDAPGPRHSRCSPGWLGFVDSGLPEGDPPPPLPDGCFALVPLEMSTPRLVEIVRRFRPHVMTTYNEDGGYPHLTTSCATGSRSRRTTSPPTPTATRSSAILAGAQAVLRRRVQSGALRGVTRGDDHARPRVAFRGDPAPVGRACRQDPAGQDHDPGPLRREWFKRRDAAPARASPRRST